MLLILGLFLFIVVLEIGLRVGGFIILCLQEYKNKIVLKQKDTYRIMCLGESTTAEGGSEDPYPSQLEEIINQKNIGIKFSVINKGFSAIDTSYILAHVEDNLNRYKPNMVITMMGINDFGPHIPYGDPSASKTIRFFKNFRTYKLTKLLWLHMVAKAKELGIYKLKVFSIFPSDTKLKNSHIEQINYPQKEELLRKVIELNMADDKAYIELGWFYLDQGKFSQAEEMFKKALEINDGNDEVYVGFGWLYTKQAKYGQAEEMFKKAIEINPKNYRAYSLLGWSYKRQGRLIRAEELFKKTKDINPCDDWAYVGLGWIYRDQNNYTQAEESLRKAIDINPGNEEAWIRLGWLYVDLGKYTRAEEVFKKAVEMMPVADRVYGSLKVLYAEIRKYDYMQEYARKTNELRARYYNSIIRRNHQHLKDILDKRDIKLVCIQYPMRSIEPLKKLFDTQDGIVFVDNEMIFKDALTKESYKEYFTDMFGGDFGHCTRKGNRLLAENIANVLLKKVFNK